MKVAVVGSGVAGLAAAWRLSKQGVQVTVLEKDSHIGGHAFTYRTDDDVDVDLGFMSPVTVPLHTFHLLPLCLCPLSIPPLPPRLLPSPPPQLQ
ncbi:unnamed protein product, partial [Closterium sp. NIES-53]